MIRSIYVDDFDGRKNNVSDLEVMELYRKAKSRMKDGNFNLRKWESNFREFTKMTREGDCVENDAPMISEEDETYDRTNLGDKVITEATERKYLGHNWNRLEDHSILQFDLLIQFAKELPLSKRSDLKVVAKLYDPLVFLSPLYTSIKVIIQELCKLKFDWDEALCYDLKSR